MGNHSHRCPMGDEGKGRVADWLARQADGGRCAVATTPGIR